MCSKNENNLMAMMMMKGTEKLFLKNSERKKFILKTSCFSHKTRECHKMKRRKIMKTNHLADGKERDGAIRL